MIQVWCDVGGTFTDCFVVEPGGQRLSTKVLSNGLIQGRVHEYFLPDTLCDPARCNEPTSFWNGAKLRLIDPLGNPVWESRCVEHNHTTGRLRLEAAIPNKISEKLFSQANTFGYELHSGIEAPVLATRLLLGIGLDKELPPVNVRLGTTRGTNALLTRRGARTVLLTTGGFRDILRIGYQERPHLFALDIRKREPLYEAVVEIDERTTADGRVLIPINEQKVRKSLEELMKNGIHSLAICLLHGYQNPEHEQMIARWARDIGFHEISVSSEVAPMIKLVSRAETTVVDAYLGPVVRDYLSRVGHQFGNKDQSSLRVMASHGGLFASPSYRGKDSVLSGPAGGAVALTKLARAANIVQVIGLDMGGTSTDVCRIAGTPTIEYEAIKAGVRLMTPMLAIHTVAAGGGSICAFDGIQWRVGPQSAGADPGPACYGRGGPLTVTDLNLLLGRILPDAFPFPLQMTSARHRLAELLEQAKMANDDSTAYELAAGLRRIANENMAAAVRSISIAQGSDPRHHSLVGFGGAAGQHICEIADILQIDTILDPPDAGLLSALGIGLASVTRWSAKALYQALDSASPSQLESIFLDLQQQCAIQLAEEHVEANEIRNVRTIELRYLGTDQPLALPMSEFSMLQGDFSVAHRRRFGYDRSGIAIEIVALRVEAIADVANDWDAIASFQSVRDDLPDLSRHQLYSRGAWCDGWSVKRKSLGWGHRLTGPGIVLSEGSTTVIDAGWSVEVLSDRSLKLCRLNEVQSNRLSEESDPVLGEVIAQRLAAIADSMGIVLEQTAISVNIKERRDYSCAVFTANGDLIANAPHVPVHLGAMSETVKRMIEQFPKMTIGDCFITNDPYRGGSHLPDVTVVTPVFTAKHQIVFFTASRAHHAEIGGIAPGSMSPLTTCLEEEGVIIPAMHLVQAGQNRLDEIRTLLTSARYPSRSVEENLADMIAQQAANRRGEQFLLELVSEYTWQVIEGYLEHIQEVSERKVRRWIDSFGSIERTFADSLDDGTPIVVKLTFGNGRLTIDLTGSGPVSSSNFNANPAIVTAAVIYVVRLMIDDELPLNSGVLRPISILIKPGILNAYQSDLPLSKQPAVAAGNVETSQRIVDCLLGALRVAGASQGTMNNLLMGNASFGYYETIGGGAGATRTSNGADAVHTHMTNTRLTDPEVLESRYPVQLTRFEIRNGSGGDGLHRGGEGLIREMLMQADLEVSLVSSRRGENRPYGMEGGQPGSPGENYRVDIEGNIHPLPSTCQIRLSAGERIGIKTPGGGGFGSTT
ncbi:MAG: hydantoinase B/oxoprolinase family protein [Pirellulaceae bacterium]|nr:hydantoinase B/oxoprolinase family protein [Pirellulaceae bacterium]